MRSHNLAQFATCKDFNSFKVWFIPQVTVYCGFLKIHSKLALFLTLMIFFLYPLPLFVDGKGQSAGPGHLNRSAMQHRQINSSGKTPKPSAYYTDKVRQLRTGLGKDLVP